MKVHTKIFGVVLLCISAPSFSKVSYGYITQVVNNYAGSLYFANTDQTPGTLRDNTGKDYPGCQIIKIEQGSTIHNPSSSKFVVPWESVGGKMYVWLKDNAGNIVSAAKLYDQDDNLYFVGDPEMTSNPNIEAPITRNKRENDCQKHWATNINIRITATPEGKIRAEFACGSTHLLE